MVGAQESQRPVGIPTWPRWWWVRWLRRALLTLLIFPILRIGYSTRIKGRENTRLVTGPCIIVSNHNMHLDMAMLLRALPMSMRQRVSIAAASTDIFGNRYRGFLAGLLGNAFPFARRGSGVRDSLENVGKLLNDGWHVLIYPEGKLTVNGPMEPFKPGVGRLAVELGATVLPMRIDIVRPGFYEGKWFPTPRAKVVVNIGRPLRFAAGTDHIAAMLRLEEAVRNA
ncbi:MAG: lysophospholipid acyltransferase family protein [Dehalococcoidia bacterium]|nr:1-acyl-sn-glycerol-3-phosphate acyltransferase [Dehalococcoidia bacterium]